MPLASEVAANGTVLNAGGKSSLAFFSGNFSCQLQMPSQVVSSYLHPETALLDENGHDKIG